MIKKRIISSDEEFYFAEYGSENVQSENDPHWNISIHYDENKIPKYCHFYIWSAPQDELDKSFSDLLGEDYQLKVLNESYGHYSCRVLKKKDTPEARKFWEAAEKAREQVSQWPEWKKAWLNTETDPEEKKKEQRYLSNKTALIKDYDFWIGGPNLKRKRIIYK